LVSPFVVVCAPAPPGAPNKPTTALQCACRLPPLLLRLHSPATALRAPCRDPLPDQGRASLQCPYCCHLVDLPGYEGPTPRAVAAPKLEMASVQPFAS